MVSCAPSGQYYWNTVIPQFLRYDWATIAPRKDWTDTVPFMMQYALMPWARDDSYISAQRCPAIILVSGPPKYKVLDDSAWISKKWLLA